MTKPLIGGRYVRDKKTGQLRHVPDEHASAIQTETPSVPAVETVEAEIKGRTK